MADRLAWAWEHVYWTDEQWDRVIESDEFSTRTGGGQVYVTRRAEEKYLPECYIAKFRGYSSWMAWGCIASRLKGPLIFFEKDWNKGKINLEVYCTYILPAFTNTRRIYEEVLGGQAVLIEDGASSHIARATRSTHQGEGNILMV
jgi:hypothetical protein